MHIITYNNVLSEKPGRKMNKLKKKMKILARVIVNILSNNNNISLWVVPNARIKHNKSVYHSRAPPRPRRPDLDEFMCDITYFYPFRKLIRSYGFHTKVPTSAQVDFRGRMTMDRDPVGGESSFRYLVVATLQNQTIITMSHGHYRCTCVLEAIHIVDSCSRLLFYHTS